ncbi:MAG: formate dehydrogenase [Proteobacteria bacterium]|nr:formate dehydrogenase [Pseudomonadota bacterium]
MANSNDASLSGNLKRRKFLLTAGLGIGGAVAAAAGVKTLVKEDAAALQADQPKDKGYQATEHVRNYYRSARV